MKRVVSVSIGSSERNHRVEVDILGEPFVIERIGTDGDMEKAVELIRELDGKVDAFGMGGIDLFIWAGSKRYTFRDGKKIFRAATKTPIVDGTGLKNSLERKVVNWIQDKGIIDFKGCKVLLTSGMDRFGMAEALVEHKADLVLGDLMFALGVPIPLHSLKTLHRLAAILAPIIVQLPFELLYPTGQKQVKESKPRFEEWYQWADVIAGDFLFIKRYMPKDLSGKTILTNTVTAKDVEDLKRRGVKRLITTTPELSGRSFGTNVIEGVLVTLADKPYNELTQEDYLELLERIGFEPRLEELA
ncbi:MAG: quinate 5-dehydrogenase [Firmicutes bacterium]|nr:quinate 5-dehydrogenase [Bacillota bacterium]